MVAAAVVGSAVASVGSGFIQSNAAKKAASTQANAQNAATAAQQGMFNVTQENLQPYMDSGAAANNLYQSQLPSLTSPVVMDQAALQHTPGYNFNLTQGLKAAQNSAAARGLGTSGAAFKGAEQFATGLADSTYQNQFNNAWTNKLNAYDMLSDATKVGANAAAGLGQISSNVGHNLSETITGAGNARAAGTLGSANALAGGMNGLQSAVYANQILGGNNTGLYGSSGGMSDGNFTSFLDNIDLKNGGFDAYGAGY